MTNTLKLQSIELKMHKSKIVRIMENEPKPSNGLLLHSQQIVTHYKIQSSSHKDEHGNTVKTEISIPVKQVVSFYQVPIDE
ncbi:MAG: hypothetical protein QG594_2059 [Bacteroidota bacterium]|nr:hypothetical protein [Bacteroidota bacterium]